MKTTEDICENVHRLLRQLPRHKFPFNEEKIPLNGIYVFLKKESPVTGEIGLFELALILAKTNYALDCDNISFRKQKIEAFSERTLAGAS